MESARGYLLFALALVTFLLYQKWQEDFPPKTSVPQKTISETTSNIDLPELTSSEEKPSLTQDSMLPENINTPQDATNKTVPSLSSSERLVVLKTEHLEITIDREGGDVVEAKLLKFAKELSEKEDPVVLLTQKESRVFIARSGLMGQDTPDYPKNTRITRAVYTPITQKKTLEEGDEQLEWRMQWTNSTGVVFEKVFRLYPGKYHVDVAYHIKNKSNTSDNYRFFNQLVRDAINTDKAIGFGLRSYVGGAYSTQDISYEKHSFGDFNDEPLKNILTKGGWIAFLQHYFVSSWIPNQNGENQITSGYKEKNGIGEHQLLVIQSPVTIESGEEKEIVSTLYLGPKNQKELEKLASGLQRTVDYGFFWWIGEPIFWLLTFFQSVVFNWGVAIILVTMTVKLFLYPLANAQYRSFAKMRLLTPKFQKIKERYGDDRQNLSKAMMELYKKEKVNPLGGCLPLLIQMPVFLALYWVLIESYEIRHAPFAFWIQDLSTKDPYFVLPILMGLSMWLMQKLQPMSPTMDPMQQKIMQMLPVMMTVFFVFFPAGLVLYWVINNVLSIAQQVYITRKIEKEAAQKQKKKG